MCLIGCNLFDYDIELMIKQKRLNITLSKAYSVKFKRLLFSLSGDKEINFYIYFRNHYIIFINNFNYILIS